MKLLIIKRTIERFKSMKRGDETRGQEYYTHICLHYCKKMCVQLSCPHVPKWNYLLHEERLTAENDMSLKEITAYSPLQRRLFLFFYDNCSTSYRSRKDTMLNKLPYGQKSKVITFSSICVHEFPVPPSQQQ